MIWATIRSRPCFCWLYRASSSLTPLRRTHKHLRLKLYDTNPQIFRDFTLWTQMFKYLNPFNGIEPQEALNTDSQILQTHTWNTDTEVVSESVHPEPQHSSDSNFGAQVVKSSRTSQSDFLHQISQNQIWTDSLKVLRFWILNPDLPNKSDLNHVKYWLWRISVTAYTEYGT